MDAALQAADVLRETEASLRDLVSKAASSGDYQSVLQVASWAQALSDLLKKAPAPHPSKGTPLTRPLAKESPPKKKAHRDEYPKFLREGDHLIRIAWSKKEKKEYQHKAPKSVVRALAVALAEAGKNGKVFATDSILPISDSDGGEIPNYQSYLAIALLRHLQLIRQHGRQGYSVPAPDELGKAIDTIWDNLPHK
jgi:hypothetical protein